MTRTIRRTIVVEYESEESIDCERYCPLWWSDDRGL